MAEATWRGCSTIVFELQVDGRFVGFVEVNEPRRGLRSAAFGFDRDQSEGVATLFERPNARRRTLAVRVHPVCDEQPAVFESLKVDVLGFR